MKKQILAILTLGSIGFSANAQVNIPDAAFKTYLVNNFAINTNADAEIQVSEANSFNGAIYCGNLGISDLTGIEEFTNLTTLDCQVNNLTTIDVTQNVALLYLLCNNNSLTALNVTQNTALTNLDCHANNLTTINVSQNTTLINLSCDNNSLAALDVTQNYTLTNLGCSNNSLTSLNVTQNVDLIELRCGHNSITNLDVIQNINLKNLYCFNNQLSSLDVSQNTDLEYLYCEFNALTVLDVSQNTELIALYCENNSIITLDLSQNTALIAIWCSDNSLTSLNVANGANTNIGYSFYAVMNPNLTCIQVDDSVWSTANWLNIDATANFGTSCVLNTVNIEELKNIDISIYPNPTSGQLTIENGALLVINILDITGKIVLNYSKITNTIDVSSLTNGVYFLQIKTENGIAINKIIKQ